MKKVAFIMVGLLAILFSGCGEGSSTSTSDLGSGGTVPVVNTVDASETELTTPSTPHNISSVLGTPPGLPNE